MQKVKNSCIFEFYLLMGNCQWEDNNVVPEFPFKKTQYFLPDLLPPLSFPIPYSYGIGYPIHYNNEKNTFPIKQKAHNKRSRSKLNYGNRVGNKRDLLLLRYFISWVSHGKRCK
jgi:hypothetical protein